MPQIGLTMVEGTITAWLKKPGDAVKKGEPLVEIDIDKLNDTLKSESDGVLISIIAHEGAIVPVKGILGYIGEAGEKAPDAESAAKPVGEAAAPIAQAVSAEQPKTSAQTLSSGGRIKISPLAKKTALKNGVDISALTGTGPGGRIVQKDVLSAPTTAAKPAPRASDGGHSYIASARREKLSAMRKTIGARMSASHNEIPSVTVNIKIYVDELIALRADINAGRDKDKKLSLNDFLVKAAAKTLSKNKALLVSLEGSDVLYNEDINIGIAVALDDGLIVPVVKNADKIGVETISETIKDLAKRAREGSLALEEQQGSTFTISNLGMFGVESFTSIINQPNSAILGIASALSEVDLDEFGKPFKRQAMKAALTIDHRLLDGAAAAKFIAAFKETVEKPMNILL
jgi:pyruvate dehydrogenase E2 component (dihydrolipoamide acetyltransferase)